MTCHYCKSIAKKHGRTKQGLQRFRCPSLYRRGQGPGESRGVPPQERGQLSSLVWVIGQGNEIAGAGVLDPSATAIFDREGKRIFRLIGEVKKKQLVERLEWLLGKQEGRSPRELLLPGGIDSSEYKEQ